MWSEGDRVERKHGTTRACCGCLGHGLGVQTKVWPPEVRRKCEGKCDRFEHAAEVQSRVRTTAINCMRLKYSVGGKREVQVSERRMVV